MTVKHETKWTTVDIETNENDDLLSETSEMKVIGGWLYRTVCYTAGASQPQVAVAMVFVEENPS